MRVAINKGIPRPDKSPEGLELQELKALAIARRMWAEIDLPSNCRLMQQVYEEAPVFAEAMGYESGDQFITDYLKLDLDLLHRVVGWLAQEQPREPVPLAAAIKAAKAQPLAQHGAIGNGRKDESRGSDATSTGQDRGRFYLLRRIARDQPELLDQIGPGKQHRSARAAAIAAGIIKPIPTVRIGPDIAKVAADLKKHLSREQLAALAVEINS